MSLGGPGLNQYEHLHSQRLLLGSQASRDQGRNSSACLPIGAPSGRPALPCLDVLPMRSDLRSENEVMQYRVRFTISAHAEGLDPVDETIQCVSKWFRNKGKRRLFGTYDPIAWDRIRRGCISIETGELSMPAGYVGGQPEDGQVGAASRRIEDDRGVRYWAFELDEPDSSWKFRRWHTCVGISRSDDGSSAAVNIRNSYYMLQSYFGGVQLANVYSIPGIAQALIKRRGLDVRCGNTRVEVDPVWVDAKSFGRVAAQLRDPGRDLALIFVVTDESGVSPIDNIEDLAKAVMGMANVYILDGSNKELMEGPVARTFRYKTASYRFRLNPDMVRIYPPGVDIDKREDSPKSRFYLGRDIRSLKYRDQYELFREINRAICSMTARGADDIVDLDDIARRDAALRFRTLALRAVDLKEKLDRTRKQRDEHVRAKTDSREIEYLNVEVERLQAQVEEWQQLADSYAEQVETLAQEVSDCKAALTALHIENDALRSHLTKKGATQAPTCMSVATIDHVPTSLEELVELMEESWPERVVVLDDARKSAERFRFAELDEAWAILKSIPTVLWDMHFNGAGSSDIEEEYLHRTGYHLARTETGNTKDNPTFMKQRTHRYGDEDVLMLSHIKGRSKDPKRAFRVYYYADHERNVIVIGHCGGHLDTDGTRRRGF